MISTTRNCIAAASLLVASTALPTASVAAAQPVSSPTAPLEIAFCPDQVVRTYPLSDAPKTLSLVLQNFAVINRSSAPVVLKELEISLMDAAQKLDVRTITGAGLDATAKSGARTKASGALQAFAFQFCDGNLIAPEAEVSDDSTLAPGEALLVTRQVFAWRGARSHLAVRARGEAGGKQVEASAELPIDSSTSKSQMTFPLKGRSMVVVAATPHGAHRWALPEEFGLDIVRFGEGTRTYRGTGERWEDYYVYGASVRAAATGKVVLAENGQAEDLGALRKAGEPFEAYAERVGQIQAALLAKGDVAIAGNVVVIDHGGGEYSLYGHLKPGSLKVKVGQTVAMGETIAAVGSSGNSTEPHLHFQVCDGPSILHCAGIPPSFTGIEIPYADGPRALQAGDVVVAD